MLREIVLIVCELFLTFDLMEVKKRQTFKPKKDACVK